ncbi:alpha-N-acetylglucosaminidase [Pedobacter nyackensis]|uniref:alpha-N-acetylglucosaminidase n=1 Tax=Pedobacter nyackensis TaxID=475255 RepID=UPI00292D2550|nr:alpha-N-acetylglucosaminidase [Pedobacter nyackensis]
MKKIYVLICLLFLQGLNIRAQEPEIDFTPLKNLVSRQIPWLGGKVVFSQIKENGGDRFEISTKNNKLYVEATSKSAAGQGINWYLKYYAKQMISLDGDNIKPLSSLPVIKNKEIHASWADKRYAHNYCTFNYTMSFWGWKEWERELDWMSLNGVNVALALTGVEEVWYNTLKQFSFTATEIDDFIPGPAFHAWWLMGNLEGWGGPMPERMRKDKVVLQQKIIKRMHELGIEPELHGFYGMVPKSFLQKFPQAKVVDQGKWAGGFDRPAMLDPSDPLFKKVGDVYYQELKKLYGNDIKYFGGDPFHEGGKAGGIDVEAAAKNIQQLMQQHYKGSTWLLMGWGGNPKADLLAGLDRKYTMVQDLFGEARNEWEKSNGFNGFPFMWNIVNNFGGKEGMYGKLDRLLQEPQRAAKKYPNTFAGIGVMPEGIADNPIVYDMMFSMPWMAPSNDAKHFVQTYPQYRYGKYNAAAVKAWEFFLQTAYFSHAESQEGPTESLLCARPSLDIKSVSTWGTRRISYDPALFESGVKYLMDAAGSFKNVPTYRFDLIDAVRQMIANKSQIFHTRMREAYLAKNAKAYANASKSFLKLILLQDNLLKGDQRFMLSTWLKQARAAGYDKASKDLCERNARLLITIWGPDTNPSTDLHEYSHREWNGLLKTLYYNRWKLFIDQQQMVLDGKLTNPVPIDFFTIEKKWANELGGNFPETPEADYVSLVKNIYNQVIAMP